MKSAIFTATLLVACVAYIQADTSAIPNADQLLKQALDNIETGVKKFSELTGIQTEFDKSKLEKFLKETFGKSQENLQELLKKLEKDSKPYSDEIKKNVENIIKQFNETVKNINTPEVQGKLTKFHESIQASVKKVGEQASEVSKSLGVAVPPNIQKTLNEIYDEISKTGHKLQEKANQIVADAQAELKKKQKS